jgi:hypothetical protein
LIHGPVIAVINCAQSLLGMARVTEAQGDLHDALRTINELHVKHSWFAPALMEKARLSLAVHGWQEAMETVSQLQQVDTNNVIAYTFHGNVLPHSCPVVWRNVQQIRLQSCHAQRADRS